MRKLTPYGKAMRMERLKREIIALDMAQMLGVTPSFLSSVELGRKKVPAAWLPKLHDYFSFSQEELKKLEKIIHQSNSIVSKATHEISRENKNSGSDLQHLKKAG